MKPNFELVSTADILDELLRRYDACIFAGLKIGIKGTTERQNKWSGVRYACAGLAAAIPSQPASPSNAPPDTTAIDSRHWATTARS